MTLKSCPFCGFKNCVESSAIRYAIICMSCAARGPIENTKARAEKAWNKRKEEKE